jgi:hypothetical protein
MLKYAIFNEYVHTRLLPRCHSTKLQSFGDVLVKGFKAGMVRAFGVGANVLNAGKWGVGIVGAADFLTGRTALGAIDQSPVLPTTQQYLFLFL